MLKRMAEGGGATPALQEGVVGAPAINFGVAASHTSRTLSALWENTLRTQDVRDYGSDATVRNALDSLVQLTEDAIKHDIRKQHGEKTSLTEMVDFASLKPGARMLAATTIARHRHLQEAMAGDSMNAVPSYLYAPLPTIAVTQRALQDSVFQELMFTFPMAEYQSALYLLSPVYGKAKGAVAAGSDVRLSNLNDYASGVQRASLTADNTTTLFTLTVAGGQLAGPFYQNNVRLLIDNQLAGSIGPDGNLRSYNDNIKSFKADQVAGSIVVEFDTAPAAGVVLTVLYNLNYQDDANFDKVGAISLKFQRIPFQWMEFPIDIEVALLPELMYSTTMNVQMSPALIETSAKEIARALDAYAVEFLNSLCVSNTDDKLEYDVLFRNSSQTFISNPVAWRTYVINQMINQANAKIARKNKQGAVTQLWGSVEAMSYFTMSDNFQSSGLAAANRRGAFKLGSVLNAGGVPSIDLYAYANSTPQLGFKDNRVFFKYDDPAGMNVSAAIGVYSLFVESMRLQNKRFVTSQGAMALADMKEINRTYTGYIDMINYDPSVNANSTNF